MLIAKQGKYLYHFYVFGKTRPTFKPATSRTRSGRSTTRLSRRFNDWVWRSLETHWSPQQKRNESRHDKTNKVTVRPAKTLLSLGIRPVWSESLLPAWRNLGSLATHWAHSGYSDQTGRMPRLIWVFAGRRLTQLVLSCRGSNHVRVQSMNIKWTH